MSSEVAPPRGRGAITKKIRISLISPDQPYRALQSIALWDANTFCLKEQVHFNALLYIPTIQFAGGNDLSAVDCISTVTATTICNVRVPAGDGVINGLK